MLSDAMLKKYPYEMNTRKIKILILSIGVDEVNIMCEL